MQQICCFGRLLVQFFAGPLAAVVMVVPPCLLNLVPGNRVRLVAEVDWPFLFEYCGDGAAYWRVVDVTSLLHLTKVLLADSLGHFMNPDWIGRFLLLLQDSLLLAFRMPFAGLLIVACEAAELHCAAC
ncbi:hypothetical protein Nepgr_011600 [Nepenthes gracilis]|uniref:Uncharacterized protein n=1 Tax=Nepenthes gracilis TaxID=150966 RepID=A0AAD3SF50_NEPGR|nr:hypothetical protein Nepgr_011600 [Nepenthes gracilis]